MCSRSLTRLDVSLLSDKGCVRAVNEDAASVFSSNDPDLVARKGKLIVVADGMGGHAGGEVASNLATRTIGRIYYELPQPVAESLKMAFETANKAIHQAAIADQELAGMGTTCTALVVCGNCAFAAHVGDSRLYLLRNGEIYLMTEDHSAVREMVKSGIITADEARKHEDKNVIIRALGTASEVEVSMWDGPLATRDRDTFIICSDGLYDLVEDAEIKELIEAAPDNHTACADLIELAKKRGGYDNITVGIISIRPAGESIAGYVRETREAEVLV